jgi:hypothetical protein
MPFGCESDAVGGTKALKSLTARKNRNAHFAVPPRSWDGKLADCKAPSGKGADRARGRCPQGAKGCKVVVSRWRAQTAGHEIMGVCQRKGRVIGWTGVVDMSCRKA